MLARFTPRAVLLILFAGAALAAQALTAGVAAAWLVEPATQPLETSRYVAVPQTRVMDSRIGHGGSRLPAGIPVVLDLAPSVPPGATAVVANLTITRPSAPLYVVAWPSGPVPATSTINVSAAGHTRANLATIPLAGDRTIQLLASSPTDLVIDLSGYYEPAATATGGRFQSLTPVRLVDTRESPRLMAYEPLCIDVSGELGGAESALVLTVTATEVRRPGVVGVLPPRVPYNPDLGPPTSNLNLDTPGQTVSNQVVAATERSGVVCLVVQTVAHIVIDLVGFYTSDMVGAGTDGLFVPLEPQRIVDTRDASLSPFGIPRTLQPSETASVGLPAGSLRAASAVVGNLTITDNEAPTYATVWEGIGSVPWASSLYADSAGSMTASHVASQVADGSLQLYAPVRTHVVLDLTGYFTAGGPIPPPPPG